MYTCIPADLNGNHLQMNIHFRLIETMNSTLKELRKAIKGLVVMSADLESMLMSFQNNQVRLYAYVDVVCVYAYLQSMPYTVSKKSGACT